MRGQAGAWLIDKWMTDLRATTPYAAMHTAAPNPVDPTATEITGGWYSRKAFLWDALDDTAVANAAVIKWSGVPATTIVGIAVYTTSTGSSLMLWCPYATPFVTKAGGTLPIAAHDLYVEII